MNDVCPKCKTVNGVNDASHFRTRAVMCYSCGAYHERGSSPESITRQVTGCVPATTERRKAQEIRVQA